MAQQFNPDTGEWTGSSDSPIGGGGVDTSGGAPPVGTDIPPQTWAPPPITVGQAAPSNVDPAYWASLQSAMKSSPAVTNGQQTPGAQTATPDASAPPSLTATRTMDDATILAQIAAWSKLPGANPSLANDPNYWLGRIKDTGGLATDNAAYWQGLAMRPEGAPEGGVASAGSGPTSVQIPPGQYAGLTPPSSPMTDAGNAAILKLLQTPQTVDAESVAESPEAVAERLQSQRSAEHQIAASAEQAAQSGEAGTGGEQGLQRQILANQGEQDSLFQGTLASTLRQQQIQQLESGIQYAQQSGQFDKAQQLQAQLAQLSAGLSLDQLGYNYAALNAGNNNAALQAILGL